MNEPKNNGKGIFYGVIGVATLIVAIIGATFAYFTASQTGGENEITGNAATISFTLLVDKVTDADDQRGGLIPMTDGMATPAVANACVDDNNNAVCQIYSVTVRNTGSAAIFLDGYVNVKGNAPAGRETDDNHMRWAQVFATSQTSGEGQSAVTTWTYSTSGVPTLANGQSSAQSSVVAVPNLTLAAATGATSATGLNTTGTTGTYYVGSNPYDYISNNYMRDSSATGTARSDMTNALVFNQQLTASDSTDGSGTDETVLYFVVWLSETGNDQTFNSNSPYDFFNGQVKFISAAGGEVSATFNGYTRLARAD